MRVVSDCQSRLSVSVSMDMDAWCKHMNMNMNMNRHELLRRVASVWLHGYWHHAARLELHRPSYPVPTLKCWRRTSGGSSGARSRSRRSGCNRQRRQVCHQFHLGRSYLHTRRSDLASGLANLGPVLASASDPCRDLGLERASASDPCRDLGLETG